MRDQNFNRQPLMHQRGQHRQQADFSDQRGNVNNLPGPPSGFLPPHQRARYQQQAQLDPNVFQRGGTGPPRRGQYHGHQQLFNPNQPQVPPQHSFADQNARQVEFFEQLAAAEISNVEMSPPERDGKESFRVALEKICHEVCAADPDRLPEVSLECFGSFKSGFATGGSDMDLVIVVQDHSPTSACFSLLEDDLPRALEKRLLQLGHGARLLSRTRVPIIKVCEKPGASFLDKLREEREKWDSLPNEKKYPHLYQNDEQSGEVEEAEQVADGAVEDLQAADMKLHSSTERMQVPAKTEILPVNGAKDPPRQEASNSAKKANAPNSTAARRSRQELEKPWTRERKAGPLDFPKTGVGIQSDINFFNPLGLHNTQMLRCYSLCDLRVRPMVLFVKAWAKRRKINSSYSGTLSSYGYVLMVLHYLVNVAQPPVLPNLQGPWRPMGDHASPDAAPYADTVDGWNVTFWRNEYEITTAAQRGQLTANREPLGSLLAGFFSYYSSQGGGRSFYWMQEVLSLRSVGRGGLLSKEEKGWVKATTEEAEGKKIQHRYLFCIEDPFELNHNVARTVTHSGIVAIRDEFRRARRIALAVGKGEVARDGQLFAEMVEAEDFQKAPEETKRDNVHNGAAMDPHAPPSANQQAYATSSVQTHMPAPRPARKPATHGGTHPQSKSKALNVQDSDAFPALGPSGKPSKKMRSPRVNTDTEEFSEISGEKAKAVLEKAKRKKAKAQVESTAMGAAEAVLRD